MSVMQPGCADGELGDSYGAVEPLISVWVLRPRPTPSLGDAVHQTRPFKAAVPHATAVDRVLVRRMPSESRPMRVLGGVLRSFALSVNGVNPWATRVLGVGATGFEPVTSAV